MILIVDDKYENLFSLKSLLQLHGYEVDTANSGEEALRRILKTDYTLIILDVQMPGMDGFEVAENVSGYSRSKDVPIIFLSAVNTDKRFITKGYASGAIDYLTKPFDPDLLLLKVKTFNLLSVQTKKLNETQKQLEAEIDIRKKAEEELEKKVMERTAQLLQSNKELEESNNELQQYAFIASHDLQEPLRKIQTFTRLVMERHMSDDPEAVIHMNKILSSSARMRSLINDLLTYSKLSAKASFQSYSLTAIVEEVLSDLELAITEKEALVVKEHLPLAEVVPVQMRQVFENIISNALKFSKENTRPKIEIKCEVVNAMSFMSEISPTGNFCRITVADNGIGFNEEYLDKIFALFQRLNARGQYEGTGIGLSIVKKIIDKHNGLITAKSEEEKGTQFIFILPLKQTHSAYTPPHLVSTLL